MKEILESDFTFFKAGQGAFYGGRIYDPKNRNCWTIVYDCGSSSFVKGNIESLKNEIDYFNTYQLNYCQSSEKKIIDILFISHLDYDHVSGVLKLINDFEVKKIILPYFQKSVRVFALFSIIAVEDSMFLIDDYFAFIENPYSFLSERIGNNSEIFVIFSEEQEYLIENSENEDDGIIPVGTIYNDSFPELQNISNVKKYKNNLQFFLGKRWVFTCFYKEINDQILLKLKNCLLKLLPNNEPSFENIKEIFKNKKTREKAHSCYKKHLSDINSHGLILLHGPINFKEISGNISCNNELNMKFPCDRYIHIDHFRMIRKINFLGTLLMGDTSLISQTNNAFFPQQINLKLPYVHIFQVPHHGSSKNWDFTVFNDFQIGAELRWRMESYAVCNFGYGNTYGHPSPEVLDNLSECIILNSQFLRFTTRYYIYY